MDFVELEAAPLRVSSPALPAGGLPDVFFDYFLLEEVLDV